MADNRLANEDSLIFPFEKEIIDNFSDSIYHKSTDSINWKSFIDLGRLDSVNLAPTFKSDSGKFELLSGKNKNSLKVDSVNGPEEKRPITQLKDTAIIEYADTVRKYPKRRKFRKTMQPIELLSFQLEGGAVQLGKRFDFKNEILQGRSNDTEQIINGFDFGAQLNFAQKNIIYAIGVNYNQWSEKFTYESIKYWNVEQTNNIGFRQITSYSLSYQNIGHSDNFGNYILDTVIITMDTVITNELITEVVTKEKRDTIKQKGEDAYEYINIPIRLGYAFHADKLTIVPMVGGSIGFPISSMSHYADAEAIEIRENINAPTVLSLELSIDFQVRYKSVGLSLVPFYRQTLYYLRTATTISNKYSGMGANIGIAYYLK